MPFANETPVLFASVYALTTCFRFDHVFPVLTLTSGFLAAGVSEDSDYTSDINYPLQHQHNQSAHQLPQSERPGYG